MGGAEKAGADVFAPAAPKDGAGVDDVGALNGGAGPVADAGLTNDGAAGGGGDRKRQTGGAVVEPDATPPKRRSGTGRRSRAAKRRRGARRGAPG